MLFTDTELHSELLRSMGTNAFTLHVVNQVDSTNSFLLDKQASKQPQICVAHEQTSGRGRFGKSWDSETGNSLCLSLRIRMQQSLENLMGFSLVVALAIKSAIQPLISEQIQLKWPNDVLVDGKKLCGVLLETNTTSHHSVDW